MIDVKALKLFAIINCQGTEFYKALALYDILQQEDQTFISAQDKDYAPNFVQLC